MARMQFSYAQILRRPIDTMNLKDALDFVGGNVRDAAIAASSQLTHLGIRHALAGGLAVGAYGYLRNTADVDFLVGDEAFEHHGPLVTFKTGVPIEVNGVRIDYLSTSGLGPQVELAFKSAVTSEGIPIVPSDILIYMKLIANRRRDQLDVIELIRAGVNPATVRAYLSQFSTDLIPRFELLSRESSEED